jgi:hypothetical protein
MPTRALPPVLRATTSASAHAHATTHARARARACACVAGADDDDIVDGADARPIDAPSSAADRASKRRHDAALHVAHTARAQPWTRMA